jgi:hypothetical protein
MVMGAMTGVMVGASAWGTAQATIPVEPPPDTVPAPVDLQEPPLLSDPNVISSPLVVVPAGCQAPPSPIAVFVGTLLAADATTARFAVDQVRAGSVDGYAVDQAETAGVQTIVDVRYGDDIRFLYGGKKYLVGAAPHPVYGTLSSKVRVPPQLFGGDAVIGANDTDVRCPRVEDGITTLTATGGEVDTGVLSPLSTAKISMVTAIAKPLAVAFVVLLVLAAMKLLAGSMVGAIRYWGSDDGSSPPIRRDRRHTTTPPPVAESTEQDLVDAQAEPEPASQ